MMHTGLVSVTFRQLQPAEIVDLVRQAGLEAIEWGGDIHVPHGDIKRAHEVLKLTLEAGLQVASYGSYYKVGCNDNTVSFEKVLETAEALHAPTLRVWAGDRASARADSIGWHKVIDDSCRIAALATKVGIVIAFEYHDETLTDISESACRLLSEINQLNVRCYWQPPVDLSFEARYLGLQEIAPWLSNVHVFNQTGPDLKPLAEGTAEWSQYMDAVRKLSGERFCLLEFVRGDSTFQFLEDAEVLKNICRNSY